MITQDIYQKAIKYAGKAHKNQLVPGTESNYLLHLSNVAMEVLFAYMDNQNFDILKYTNSIEYICFDGIPSTHFGLGAVI